jgi:glutamyl-tRNA reductase
LYEKNFEYFAHLQEYFYGSQTILQETCNRKELFQVNFINLTHEVMSFYIGDVSSQLQVQSMQSLSSPLNHHENDKAVKCLFSKHFFSFQISTTLSSIYSPSFFIV